MIRHVHLILLLTLGACKPAEHVESIVDKAMEGPIAASIVGIPVASGWDQTQLSSSYFARWDARMYDVMYFVGEDWLLRVDALQRFTDSLLVAEPDIPAFWAEQRRATHLLGYVVISGEIGVDSLWAPAELERLGEQVDVMIRHHNPQAGLLAPALRRLEGYWPAERVAAAASAAAQDGADWLATRPTGPPWHIMHHATEQGVAELLAFAENQP